MIFLVAGVVAFIVLVMAWMRFSAGRAERQSVATYEHALGVLGGVARRREAPASVHTPSEEELARPHVQPRLDTTPIRPIARGDVPPPRVPLQPPSPPYADHQEQDDAALSSAEGSDEPVSAAPSSVASDAGLADVVIAFDDLEEVAPPSSGGRRMRRLAPRHVPGNVARRAVTGAAAAVVLGAIGVGGWQLAAARSNNNGGLSPSVHQPRAKSKHATHHNVAPPPAPTPTSITPISVTSKLVAYKLPESSYSVSFTTVGPCWIGVQQTLGSYIWEETIPDSGSATYAAQGSIFIEVGAPPQVSISVDGVPLALPSGNVQPYEISITPQQPTST